MTHICPKCGALLLEDGAQCSFCSTPFPSDSEVAPQFAEIIPRASRRTALRAPSRDDARASQREHSATAVVEPEWRREVARRLDEYRVRRGKARPDDSQAGFSFQEIALDSAEPAMEEPRPAPARARPSPQRAYSTERVEIRIQPELEFESAATRSRPQNLLVPAASIRRRAAAALLDAASVALTCTGFAALFQVALFRWLGGAVSFGKTGAIVCGAVAFLFYVMYFSLFTYFAGSTPGMQICSLAVVRLDGSLADGNQLAWRSFGYALSAAALMLGFAWAFWDEDGFTWQDRISQTYVTAAAPIANAAAFEIPAVPRRRFAHR